MRLEYQSDAARESLLAVYLLGSLLACTGWLVALAVVFGIEGLAAESCPSAIAGMQLVAADCKVEVLQLDGRQGYTCCTCFEAAAEPMGFARIDSSAWKRRPHSALVLERPVAAVGLVDAACSLLLRVAAPVRPEQGICSNRCGVSLVVQMDR